MGKNSCFSKCIHCTRSANQKTRRCCTFSMGVTVMMTHRALRIKRQISTSVLLFTILELFFVWFIRSLFLYFFCRFAFFFYLLVNHWFFGFYQFFSSPVLLTFNRSFPVRLRFFTLLNYWRFPKEGIKTPVVMQRFREISYGNKKLKDEILFDICNKKKKKSFAKR